MAGSIVYLIVVSYIPSFAWLLFVLTHDVHPEKTRDIAYTFFMGTLLALPVVLIGQLSRLVFTVLGVSFPEIIQQFFVGAVLEELLKGFLIYIIALRTGRWDEPIDTFVYAGAVALGFAGIENLAFVLAYSQSLQIGSFESILVFRSITAVLIHVMSSFIFSYGVVQYIRFRKPLWVLIAAILLSIIVHGAYNISLYLSELYQLRPFFLFYGAICIPLWIYLLRLTRKLQKISQ